MSSRSDKLKDEILNQIAEQIKGLQLRQQTALDEGKSEFQVTANNIHLQCLLDLLDHILLHGLEKTEFGYWPFVKELTHSETVRQIVSHPQVTTDLDKGRVWIFAAFGDGLLESFIRLFLDSQKFAKRFYTKKAFLRDKERLALLQTLVSGLDYISIVLDQESPYLGYGAQHCEVDGKCQKTFITTDENAEGVDFSSGIKRDDDNSTVSSSLSSSSTIAAPLSPQSYPSCGVHETNGEENENTSEQKVHVLQTDQHESQFCDQSDTKGYEQETTSRLHHNRNFQIQQFTESGEVGFEPIKNRNGKQITRRKDQVVDAKHNKEKNDLEIQHVPYNKEKNDLEIQHVPYGHNLSHKLPPDDVPTIGCDDAVEKPSYIDLLHMSRSQSSQDSHSSCSPTNSIQSTDSMDQFCRDFDSSLNVTSAMSLNSATLQSCDNTAGGWLESYDTEKNSMQGVLRDYGPLQTATALETDQGLSNADKSPSYEGIILGIPKRPSLHQTPTTSCDVRVDQNKMLLLSLEVFEKNSEHFHRMLVFMCGLPGSQLYFGNFLLTDHAVYLLSNAPSHDGKGFQVQSALPFTILKKVEVGLNCQTVTLVSKSQKIILFIADEAVTRDFLSSLTSMILKSGHGSLLKKIISTSTFEQEASIKKWICELENLQSSSVDIRCFTFIHWCGLTGPDSSIEVLSHKSVKEGYMDCKQAQYLRSYKWTTSYFVLMNGSLYQYAKKGDEECKVILELRGSRCGGCRRVDDANRPYAFEVVSEDGSPLLVLAAYSEDESADWIFRICQATADTSESVEDMSSTVMKCVPSCLILTNVKILACLPNPTRDETFQLLSECSVQSVTRLFVDNDVRNYCILEFERNEFIATESSWFIWFKTEYELAKFERALLEAWRELFQIDLQFLVLGEGSIREKARQQAKHIEDLYRTQLA